MLRFILQILLVLYGCLISVRRLPPRAYCQLFWAYCRHYVAALRVLRTTRSVEIDCCFNIGQTRAVVQWDADSSVGCGCTSREPDCSSAPENGSMVWQRLSGGRNAREGRNVSTSATVLTIVEANKPTPFVIIIRLSMISGLPFRTLKFVMQRIAEIGRQLLTE